MKIEPGSPVPIFRQIIEGIRAELAAGVYRPGELIPSVRAQAIALRVNANTVQRAYEELEREGLIISRKGTGMIVSPGSKDAAKDGAEEDVRQTLERAIDAARAAGLSRVTIDKLYRDAWTQSGREYERTNR